MLTYLLLAATAVRLALLFGATGQLLTADEAVNGVVALDILNGGKVPFFTYGDQYGGGQIVEALLMVPLFRLFGASEIALKAVTVAESLAFLVVLYFFLRRHFPSRDALVATGLLAFSAPFVALGFQENGYMATAVVGWLGLLFAFDTACRPRLTAGVLFLSGVFLGFGYYCNPSWVFLIMGAFAFLTVTHHRLLLERPRLLAGWVLGLIAGASPLLAYHLRFRTSGEGETTLGLMRMVADPALVFTRWWKFFSHDLPYLFSVDVANFPLRIPFWSWAGFSVALLLALLGLVAAGRPLRGWLSCWRERKSWRASAAVWSWIWLGFAAIYSVLYNVHPFGGISSRYLLPTLPFLVLLAAWGVLALWRQRLAAGLGALLVFQGLQVPLLVEFAQRRTTSDWDVKTNPADVRRVGLFLEEHGYRTVVTPYEIKWKLLFLYERRIKAYSSLFGFDRETGDDAEVVRKIASGEIPLVIVLDRGLRYPLIGQVVNPEGAFYPDDFFGFLDKNGITFEAVPVGDFLVYHRFSARINFTQAGPAAMGVDESGQ